jgi:hypothetical protein
MGDARLKAKREKRKAPRESPTKGKKATAVTTTGRIPKPVPRWTKPSEPDPTPPPTPPIQEAVYGRLRSITKNTSFVNTEVAGIADLEVTDDDHSTDREDHLEGEEEETNINYYGGDGDDESHETVSIDGDAEQTVAPADIKAKRPGGRLPAITDQHPGELNCG